MRSGLRVVTLKVATINDAVTRRIGKDCEMESQVTFPNISRKKPEAVVRGA